MHFNRSRIAVAAGGALPLAACTTIKARADLARDKYCDPGWYKHPPGTVAWKLGDHAPDKHG